MNQTEPVIEVSQGETKRFRVRIRKKLTGEPYPLTGATITSDIKRSDTSPTKIASHTIVLVDLDGGEFDMVLEEEQSALLPLGRVVWDVKIVINGDVKKRPRGQYNVLHGRTV
jgi:hypothetical protein